MTSCCRCPISRRTSRCRACPTRWVEAWSATPAGRGCRCTSCWTGPACRRARRRSSAGLTTFEVVQGYWIPRGWAREGPVKTQSRIDVPSRAATVVAGRTPIAGVAWAPTRGIERVEVRIDDGPWTQADLAAPLDVDSWRQWVLPWDATPGRHTISVRATDGAGQTQTAERTPVAPDGATGHHTISVDVQPAA